MSNDHLEIVEHPGQEQPWLNRIIAGNTQETWGTETFRRQDSAYSSLIALGRMFSPVDKATATEFELIVWLDDDEMGGKLVVPIKHVTADDGPPPAHGGHADQLTAVREAVAGWKRAIDVDAVSPQQVIAQSTLGHVIAELENVVGEVTP